MCKRKSFILSHWISSLCGWLKNVLCDRLMLSLACIGKSWWFFGISFGSIYLAWQGNRFGEGWTCKRRLPCSLVQILWLQGVFLSHDLLLIFYFSSIIVLFLGRSDWFDLWLGRREGASVALWTFSLKSDLTIFPLGLCGNSLHHFGIHLQKHLVSFLG